MRVATYTQPASLTRGSLAALALLVLTVLLGSTAASQLIAFFLPAANAGVTVLWLALYTCAFIGLMLGHGINWLSWLVRYRILLVILMLGTIASITWALDVRLSFERTVHLVGSTLIAVYIGFTIPLLTTLRMLAVVLGVLFLASLASVVALPALGIEDYAGIPVWRGVFNTKNSLGFWAAIGVMLYVSVSDSVAGGPARISCFLMAGLSLVLLVFSQSATSLVVLVLAGALSVYLFIAARAQLGFIRMAVLAVLVGGLAVFAVASIETTELIGRSDDLTGRGEVWAQTWALIMQRPATGFGYGVLWFPAGDSSWIQETLTDFTWTVHHAHNGFLQVASEIGLPLAVVALLMVAQQLIEIFYCQYQRQQAGTLFVLAFSIAYLVSNFSEARFLVNRELFWILFIALPISMLRQINLVAPPEEDGATTESPTSSVGLSPWPTPVSPAPAVATRSPARAPRTAAAGVTALAPLAGESPSPWIAAAAALAAREQALDDAENAAFEVPAEPDIDDWDESALDATLDSLTLADADIDLGGDPDEPSFERSDSVGQEPPVLRDVLDADEIAEADRELLRAFGRDTPFDDTDHTFGVDAPDDKVMSWVDVSVDTRVSGDAAADVDAHVDADVDADVDAGGRADEQRTLATGDSPGSDAPDDSALRDIQLDDTLPDDIELLDELDTSERPRPV